MKRFLAALTAGLLLLAACSAPEPESPPEPELPGTGHTAEGALTLNIHLGGEPASLDPAYATADDGGSYVLHLFEGLTALGPDGKARPAAAESWELEEDEDGLPVYTFTLREEALWSDGEPVEAEDFVYAWQRVLDYQAPTPNAYLLYPIRNAQRYREGVPVQGDDGTSTYENTLEPKDLGLEAVDERTLKVTLEGPCPDFLELLAQPAFCPVRQDIVEENPESWSQSAATCVGNGRFLLQEWKHDQSLTMVWNDQDGEEPDSVVFLNFVLSEDTAAVYNDFKAGRLQYASAIPTLDRPAETEAGTLSLENRAGVYTYIFNTEKAPFDDARVRRAISLAIDREALAAAVGVDLVPAYGLVPDGIPDSLTGQDFSKALPPLQHRPAGNTEDAQKLLKEAGYPGGEGFPQLRFITNDSPAHLTAAENVRQQLAEKLGIDMAISALSTQDFAAARQEGGWDLARSGMVGTRMDPAIYLAGWGTGAAANYGKFASEDYDTLLEASYAAPEQPPEGEEEDEKDAAEDSEEDGEEHPLVIPDTRMEILHSMELLLVADEAAVIPLWQYREPALTAPGLAGVVASPLGYHLFHWAEWTPPVADTTPQEQQGE